MSKPDVVTRREFLERTGIAVGAAAVPGLPSQAESRGRLP